MKKDFWTVLFVCILSLCGCNDFLNEEPDNRAKVETASDLQELLVSAYPQATYHLICEMMSDNVADRGFSLDCVTAITDDEMYFWKEGTDSDYDSPFAVWTGFYEGIAAANYALRIIDSKPDQENYRAMRGEALLCRAFGHFLLVNLWAEHYDPATADVTPGIPYVTEPETVAIKEYKRNTVGEVYRMIEEDLRRGLQMIDDQAYTMPKFHFTRRAAHAFATRFYTYKGTEWDKVLYHSQQVVPEDFRTEMRDILASRGLTAMEFALQYTDPGQTAILLSVCVPTYYNDIWQRCPILDSRYVLTPALHTELFPNSLHNLVGRPLTYRVEGLSGTSATNMMKSYGYFKNETISSRRGMSYVNVPMLTVEDVVLNRIEAYIMQEDFDLALRDLNRFYSTRVRNYDEAEDIVDMAFVMDFYAEPKWNANIPEPHYKDLLQADPRKLYMMMAVEDLRRMEFMQEGMRWFDIKRFHLPVTHWIHWERSEIKLDRYDPRRMLQIPQEAQKAGVTPNERP
ncbi:MAG: RagB/SusD family nutrient uptake outer membrane protein [Odoribacteraceae bacterium]|nr:RagB/SusD family nutrient uptake outer membrane protein [Odoribacteraceae bacterium]